MTTHGPGRTPATQDQLSYSDVLADAVDALTTAHAYGWDWAEFVTLAVSTAAWEVGGIDLALAVRSGSWEAAQVFEMVESTGDPRWGAGALSVDDDGAPAGV